MEGFDQTRIGVVIGSGMGGLLELETQHGILINKGPSRISPFMVPKLMVNAASAQVAIRFGLKGPNYALVTACTTGVNAIGEAVRIIQRGDADIMIAGSSEAVISPLGLAGFSAMKALSTRNDAPQRPAVRSIKTGMVLSFLRVPVLLWLKNLRQQGKRGKYLCRSTGVWTQWRCISYCSARTKW